LSGCSEPLAITFNVIRGDLEEAAKDRRVESAIKNADIARRYERLLDLVGAID
jgi:hypothetical protein